MKNRWVLVWLTAAWATPLAVAAPAVLWAQQSPRFQFPDPRHYNEELTPGQIQRAQEPESAPRRPAPSQTAPKQPAPAARAIACSGAFAKDSSHLRISTAYRTENVTFTEVGAPDGKTLMASVLFPKDPKRRLEIWWQNEASRAGIHLMVINGQSTWTAPKGLRLGLPLAALERLNGKPFRLGGFDGDNTAQVSDWQGGTLATLAGGCKVGVATARRQGPAGNPQRHSGRDRIDVERCAREGGQADDCGNSARLLARFRADLHRTPRQPSGLHPALADIPNGPYRLFEH